MEINSALTGPLDAQQMHRLHRYATAVQQIGTTAAGAPLIGYTLGTAGLPRVSIVAGAHPDEPAGPLAALALAEFYQQSSILQQVQLLVIPQLDIDGAVAQAQWLSPYSDSLDPLLFARERLRRLPGADREFAWPGAPWGGTVLPECQAADDFLAAQGAVIGHLTLHGMAIAEGAWFLLDRQGLHDAQLWADLRRVAATQGFDLHESLRYGEKGFRRCGRGFCTIPSGAAMRRWALRSGQGFAQHFAWSSMEAAAARSGPGDSAPLCAVSEFPLISVAHTDDGGWRSLLTELAFADDPQALWQAKQSQYGLVLVPLATQVRGMLGMCEALVSAALRAVAKGKVANEKVAKE